MTGADAITGFGPAGVLFDLPSPAGITLTGADGKPAALLVVLAVTCVGLAGTDHQQRAIHQLGQDARVGGTPLLRTPIKPKA